MKIYPAIKRGFDVVFSIIGLILSSPILLLTALAIKLDSRGPVLFWQDRLGKGGKTFRICKFRSMSTGAEKTGSGVYSGKDDPRVTRVGKIIRLTSIDELPQLVNIIQGAMSFIGPRPPLTYHPWRFEEYTEEQKKMFSVRPGVTGWAQVNGRKTVEWNHRIEMSCWYAENMRFLLDLKIFIITIGKVFRGEDNVNKEQTAAASDIANSKNTINEEEHESPSNRSF